MPISKTKMKNAAIAAKSAALPKIPKELLDQFVSGPMTGEAVNAASMAFKKALIERALGAELGHHLGYPPGAVKPEAVSNQRNGTSGKTVLTEDGPLRIDVPRDRDASFAPLLIPKHERRFTGFDDKIIAMYARGMTMREVQGFLADQYGVEVSPEFISSVTDAVMAEVGAWQARPLEPMYPVVFFDALRVKVASAVSRFDNEVQAAIDNLLTATRDIERGQEERIQAIWAARQQVAGRFLGIAVFLGGAAYLAKRSSSDLVTSLWKTVPETVWRDVMVNTVGGLVVLVIVGLITLGWTGFSNPAAKAAFSSIVGLRLRTWWQRHKQRGRTTQDCW